MVAQIGPKTLLKAFTIDGEITGGPAGEAVDEVVVSSSFLGKA